MTPKQKNLHSIGGNMRHWGGLIQRKNLNVKFTKAIYQSELRRFLDSIGYPNVELSDIKYHLTDWETWKVIIEDDQTNLYKYITDKTDCDNFADYFNSSVAMIYGLNTSGRFSNELVKPVTGEHIGWHRASCIVCTEGVGTSGTSGITYLPFPQNSDEMEQYKEKYKWDKVKKKWYMGSSVPSGEKLVAYAYDAMRGMADGFCKIGDSQIQIKNWVYKGNYLSFN